MTEIVQLIPARLKNAATNGHVAGASDIIDDVIGQNQETINNNLSLSIAAEAERAAAAEAQRYTKSETYNKQEVYSKQETYNRTEINNMITTPSQEYVTVEATDQTTAATDVLPASGSADTIYRVGKWDGTQYNVNCYSEYSWDGTQYVFLQQKNFSVAAASDFEEPSNAQKGKITTVGAIYDSGIVNRAVQLLTNPVVLSPNILYDLGARTALSISFAEGLDGILNEYMFQFSVSGSAFTLTLPNGVQWLEEPDYTENNIYQVSVVNNLALYAEWEPVANS